MEHEAHLLMVRSSVDIRREHSRFLSANQKGVGLCKKLIGRGSRHCCRRNCQEENRYDCALPHRLRSSFAACSKSRTQTRDSPETTPPPSAAAPPSAPAPAADSLAHADRNNPHQ